MAGKPAIAKACEFTSHSGWVPRVAPAYVSPASEIWIRGGTLRYGVAPQPSTSARRHPRWQYLCFSTHGSLQGSHVAVQHSSIFIFGSYQRGCLDQDILQTVASLIDRGRSPFILLGDFNDAPNGCLTKVNVEIIVLRGPGSGTTCTAADGRGRLIDYMVVSSSIRHLVASCVVDWAAPSAPHAA